MTEVAKYKPDQTVGRWTVRGEPARGGNARVYKVVDGGGQEAALKQLFRRTPESEGRFHREVVALKQLPAHEGLVSILDVAPPEAASPWYVMSWVDRPTLADDRARFAGQLELSIAVVTRVAQALDVLHKHDIIHRDVKPDNVLLRAPEEPVLGDLGLCWLTDFSTERLTPDDRPTGAWGFRAPEHEHARVEEVGTSADVFSLVKVLWWLIDGGPPFASAHYEGDQFDLARKYNDVRMHAVRTLMSRVITSDPARRTITTGMQLAAELTKISEQLKSPSKGRVSAAVGQQIAQKARQAAAMASHQQVQQRIEDDFPNLRRRWLDALVPILEEVADGFKAGAHPVHVEVIDQVDGRGQPNNCLGMAIGRAQAFLQFKMATSGNTGRRIVFEITTHAQAHHQEFGPRFGLPAKLDRRLAGDESFFIAQGDSSEKPLDPVEFWESLATRLVRFA